MLIYSSANILKDDRYRLKGLCRVASRLGEIGVGIQSDGILQLNRCRRAPEGTQHTCDLHKDLVGQGMGAAASRERRRIRVLTRIVDMYKFRTRNCSQQFYLQIFSAVTGAALPFAFDAFFPTQA